METILFCSACILSAWTLIVEQLHTYKRMLSNWHEPPFCKRPKVSLTLKTFKGINVRKKEGNSDRLRCIVCCNWILNLAVKSSQVKPQSNHDSGEGNGTPLQYSYLENPMDGGAWKAAVHGVAEGWAQLSDFTFPFHFPALEKEMATHSSVLAWRIPGMEEPGGLPSGVAQSRTRLKWQH